MTNLNIAFTHNMNAALTPCGCQDYPRGGLANLAGRLKEMESTGPVVYIDSGDTFFENIIIPPVLKNQFLYTANTLFEGLGKLKLNYFVPGDQDFAAGEKFLSDLSHKAKFTFLLGNVSPKAKLNISYKKWDKFTWNKITFYITGVLHPDLLIRKEQRQLFVTPEEGMQKVFDEITKDGFKENNPQFKLILVSHSGLENDEVLAHLFPSINWIIGAHTMNNLPTAMQVPETQTNIVQVGSKNYYLGKISFQENGNITYENLPVREEHQDLLIPNPFIPFLKNYEEQLKSLNHSRN